VPLYKGSRFYTVAGNRSTATSLLNTNSTLLIEQLFESTLVLSALSFDFSTIAYWLATSLLSITAFAHRIDFLAYF
jgi:hypothetical protein